jgi:hypothetical protein
MPYDEAYERIIMSAEQEMNVENENLSVKDVIVLGVAMTATCVAVGALAKLGRDLAGEGLSTLKKKLEERKERKNQS